MTAEEAEGLGHVSFSILFAGTHSLQLSILFLFLSTDQKHNPYRQCGSKLGVNDSDESTRRLNNRTLLFSAIAPYLQKHS